MIVISILKKKPTLWEVKFLPRVAQAEPSRAQI